MYLNGGRSTRIYSPMNVTKIEDDPFVNPEEERIKFIIEDATPAFANALRRTILGYVEILAIEEIIMVENTTPMFDEYAAHRLGLIPLASDNLDLNRQADCDVCEGIGCDACTVALTLTMETDATSEMMVFSGDLISNNTFVYPINDEIPIMKMGKEQRLILEAQARLGTGREHAKWQPTSSLGYQYMPEIKIDPSHDFKEEVANSCPRNVFEYDEKNKSLMVKNPLNCNLCMECVNNSKEGSIEIKGHDDKIIFLVDGTGALRVEDIIVAGSLALQDMAENLIESFQVALENAENDPQLMKKVSTFERISLNQEEIE